MASDNNLVEHTVGSFIEGTFKIYFRHFGTLFPAGRAG